jgi:hypothetical protein
MLEERGYMLEQGCYMLKELGSVAKELGYTMMEEDLVYDNYAQEQHTHFLGTKHYSH